MPSRTCLAAIAIAALISLPAHAQKGKAPNAAVTYRAAIAEMKRALIDQKSGQLVIPNGNFDAPEPQLTEAWATVVKKSAVALTLFEQASETKSCQFTNDARTATWELSSTVGSGSDYWHLLLIQRAQGWQLVEEDPRTACEIAFRMLNHSNHCARDQTIAGVHGHLRADTIAFELLEKAIDQLPSQGRAKTVRWALQQLDRQQDERLAGRQIAKIAVREFEQILKLGYTEGFARTKTFRTARKQAIAEFDKMLAPLKAKQPTHSRQFHAHLTKSIKIADQRGGSADIEDLVKNGKHDAIAAQLISTYSIELYGLARGHEHDRALAKCQQALRK